MRLNPVPLDLITYRGVLALRCIDSVTGAAVADSLRVRAWAYNPATPAEAALPARRVDEAERSPHSGIYGFRALPGLESYQTGGVMPAASLAFIVHVEDGRGRYLPQTLRYDLPLAQPVVQQVLLFPAADRATPAGYTTVRCQLLRATAPVGMPPTVTVVADAAAAPAAWARVALTLPPSNPGDPPSTYIGQADGQGSVVIMAPYPLLPPGALLPLAHWTVTAAVGHQPSSQAADYDRLARVLPGELPDAEAQRRFPPFQTTLEAQGAAVLFGSVATVDVQTRTYAVSGAANASELDFDLLYGRSLVLRTQVDGEPDHPLSELLIQSA